MGQKLEGHGNDLIFICEKYAVNPGNKYVSQQNTSEQNIISLMNEVVAIFFPLNCLSYVKIILT